MFFPPNNVATSPGWASVLKVTIFTPSSQTGVTISFNFIVNSYSYANNSSRPTSVINSHAFCNCNAPAILGVPASYFPHPSI